MFEIGNTLREARLRRGLDILDCEAETKIRAKYLRAMEEEQFDLMPSPTYVRGFLRAYADFLDLDGRLVLDEYESRFGDYAPSADPARGRSARSSRARPRRRAAGPRAAAAAPAAPPHGGAAPLAGDRRRHGRRAARLARRGLGRHAGPVPGPRAAPHPAPARAPAVEPDTASTEAPMRAKKTPIVLTGTGSNGCWVQVRGHDAKGRLVYEGTLAPGQADVFKVLDGIWIRAANPAELKVTVNGKRSSRRRRPGELPDRPTEVRVVELTPWPARRARRSSSPATRCCAADPGAQRGHPRPVARRPRRGRRPGRDRGGRARRPDGALGRLLAGGLDLVVHDRRPGAHPRRPHDGGGRGGHGPAVALDREALAMVGPASAALLADPVRRAGSGEAGHPAGGRAGAAAAGDGPRRRSSHEGALVVVLPGPPWELAGMWEAALASEPLAGLLARAPAPHERVLRLCAVTEARAIADLDRLDRDAWGRLRVGICARAAELEVTVRARRRTPGRPTPWRRGSRSAGPALFSRDGRTSTTWWPRACSPAGQTVAVAESCTGGLLGARLTERPGSSAYVLGGVIAYANEVKQDAARRARSDPGRHGAVSAECAEAMARGARRALGARLGPLDHRRRGAGRRHAGEAGGARLHRASPGRGHVGHTPPPPRGDRAAIRERSVAGALHLLRRALAEAAGG